MSQQNQVLKHLKTGAGINQYEAIIEYGVLRLSAVIFELRKQGHTIKTDRVTTGSGKRIAKYNLVSQ